jgi:iron-sulfur cluster repair protein YtfE (RIC family)
MSDLNEQARPLAPAIPGATDAQRKRGRTLAMIHAMHLRDVAQVRALIKRIEFDRAAAGVLSETIARLEMTENLRDFGALCGRECNNLLYHHGAEEQQIFPILEARADAGLRAVIDKLRQEHTVIHTLLEALGAQADAVMAAPGPDSYAALKDTFDKLETAIRSHFSYEETELEEALGVFNAI